MNLHNYPFIDSMFIDFYINIYKKNLMFLKSYINYEF